MIEATNPRRMCTRIPARLGQPLRVRKYGPALISPPIPCRHSGYQTAQRKVMVSAEGAVVNVTLEKLKGPKLKPSQPPALKTLPPELDIKPAPF